MGAESTVSGFERIDPGKWATGAVAGAVGALASLLVRVGLGASGSTEITLVAVLGILVMPGAVFGLIYAGIVSLPQLAPYATYPPTGVGLGLIYGVLFWLTTVIGSSVTIGGLVGGLTFGLVIGLLYAVSPAVG